MMRRFTAVVELVRVQSRRPSSSEFSRIQRRHRQRPAFTLIEMLVSLALSTVVISAVYGAIHLQWKVRTASENQVQTARRVHGIVQDLTLDLRACRQPDDVLTAAQESTGEDAGFLQESMLQPGPDIRERVLQLEAILEHVQLIEFFGQSDSLLVTTARRSPRFPDAVDSGTQQIVWFVNTGRDVRLPFGTSETHRYQFQIRAAGQRLGLTRVEIPSANRSPKRLQDVTAASSSWTLIDESAASFHLRFFDGRHWQSSWDSSESGRMPQAVEVSLAHAHPQRGRAVERSSEQAEVSRVVIRVPQSGGTR